MWCNRQEKPSFRKENSGKRAFVVQDGIIEIVRRGVDYVVVINRDIFRKKLAHNDPFVRGLLGIFVKNSRSMVDSKPAE